MLHINFSNYRIDKLNIFLDMMRDLSILVIMLKSSIFALLWQKSSSRPTKSSMESKNPSLFFVGNDFVRRSSVKKSNQIWLVLPVLLLFYPQEGFQSCLENVEWRRRWWYVAVVIYDDKAEVETLIVETGGVFISIEIDHRQRQETFTHKNKK